MRSVPPDERGDTRPELAFPPQTTHSTSRRASEKERRTAQGVCCAQPSHGAKGRASRARGASRAKPARRRGKARALQLESLRKLASVCHARVVRERTARWEARRATWEGTRLRLGFGLRRLAEKPPRPGEATEGAHR